METFSFCICHKEVAVERGVQLKVRGILSVTKRNFILNKCLLFALIKSSQSTTEC